MVGFVEKHILGGRVHPRYVMSNIILINYYKEDLL